MDSQPKEENGIEPDLVATCTASVKVDVCYETVTQGINDRECNGIVANSQFRIVDIAEYRHTHWNVTVGVVLFNIVVSNE